MSIPDLDPRVFAKVDEWGGQAETEEDYLCRTRGLLPTWPDDVLTQCFYDHGQHFDSWEWLDLSTLRFALIALDDQEILRSGLTNEPVVNTYVTNLHKRGIRTSRYRRIHEHMSVRGTWPRAIVALGSADFADLAPVKLTHPYQLFEGHRRLALWVYLREANAVPAAVHAIWLAYLTEPCRPPVGALAPRSLHSD